METILRKPNVTHFNISDHLEFHKLSNRICNNYEAIIDDPALITAYNKAVEQEEIIYKWVRKSDFTEKKAEADHARDKTCKGIAAIVRADMKHFDPVMRDYAAHVYNLLEVYGNITTVDYDSETANIDNLVIRLRSRDYQEAVAALGIVGWIDELYNQNELFKTYVDAATDEKIVKPETDPRTARRQTDEALRAITNRITSLVVLNGKLDYAEFITEFNVLTDHYNTLVHEHYGRLHARTDITPSVIGTIPVQPFTGKPVFVIPELTLTVEKGGKQITLHPVFSVDFTVAYQNNVEPGTAKLIIKGIGKYAGGITTTFNIERME
jgi:hypothetical protein